jgi:hypothetical protein
MSITLDLTPEIEQALRLRAEAQGLPLSDYVAQIVEREAGLASRPSPRPTGQALVDACAKLRGLLTDDEVDALFSCGRSSSRAVDLGCT